MSSQTLSHSSIIRIDRTKPFDCRSVLHPFEFDLYDGAKSPQWSNYIEDKKSVALREVDVTNIAFETMMEAGEVSITAEERVKRHVAARHLCLDAQVLFALYDDFISHKKEGHQEESHLEWLRHNKGIHRMVFPGTVIKSPYGGRCIFSLAFVSERYGWDWTHDCGWFNTKLLPSQPSAIYVR
jgi:hypothetical protein